MKVNNDYRIFISIYIGSATGTETSEVRCGQNTDGTPIFQDFRLNGPIIIEPVVEEPEPELPEAEEPEAEEFYYYESYEESSSSESGTESEVEAAQAGY